MCEAIKNIKVSIIVPLYNREKTIGRCLDSLINQTLKEIEIIVVDDGSVDNGSKVVEEYCKKDSRIQLLRQPNGGPGTARNTGIRASKGEYVGFVDCDDYVELCMYENMLRAVEEKRGEVAVCQEKNVYLKEDGTMKVLSETQFPCTEIKAYNSQQVLDWFLNYTYLCLNSMCFKLVKRTIFTEKGILFPDYHRYAEDLTTSGGIFSVVNTVVFVPESLYCYIHETETMSTIFSVKKAWDVYQDMKDVVQYLDKSEYNGKADNFILGMKFSSMRQFYGDKDSANRKSEEGRKLLKEWKKERKNKKPVFAGKEIPFLHKVKVLVSYLGMDAVLCKCIQLLGNIPFFKFMV